MTTSGTLRDLFEERTTAPPANPDRAAAVAARVRHVRRRRSGTAVTAALLAVVAAVGVPLATRGTTHADRPVPALERQVDGLRVWSNGSRLTEHGSFLSTAQRSASITVTPTTWSMGLSAACSRDLGQKLGVYLSVNGHVMVGGGCGPGGGDFSRGSYGLEQQFWAGAGGHLGEPMTLRFWVGATTKEPFSQGGPPVWTGAMPPTRVSLGVYDRVDPSAYPLPARPPRLQPLDDAATMAGGRVLWALDSRQAGAEATGGTTVRLPRGGLTYDAGFVSPGQLLVSVNGTVIDRVESWGYDEHGAGGGPLTSSELRQYGLHVEVGQPVTVTVVASRFTDPGWRFQLRLPR